jgi:Mlc titration factor MtfA (ptsG expression regulator)
MLRKLDENQARAGTDIKAWREEMAAWKEKMDAETRAIQARSEMTKSETKAIEELVHFF